MYIKQVVARIPDSGTEADRFVPKVNVNLSLCMPWRYVREWKCNPPILNLGTRWRWMVCFTTWPLTHCQWNRRLDRPHSWCGNLEEGYSNHFPHYLKVILEGVVKRSCQPELLVLLCLSVCVEQLKYCWMNFCEIWYWGPVLKLVSKFQLKFGKNKENIC